MGKKKRKRLFDDQEERSRNKGNEQVAKLALAHEKLIGEEEATAVFGASEPGQGTRVIFLGTPAISGLRRVDTALGAVRTLVTDGRFTFSCQGG